MRWAQFVAEVYGGACGRLSPVTPVSCHTCTTAQRMPVCSQPDCWIRPLGPYGRIFDFATIRRFVGLIDGSASRTPRPMTLNDEPWPSGIRPGWPSYLRLLVEQSKMPND
jgi:hypothetical protein